MQLENDQVFNTLYQEEYNKIPYIFRFGRRRPKIVVGIICVLFAASLVLWSVWYGTGKTVHTSLGQYDVAYNVYDMRYLVAMIITIAAGLLLSLWAGIGLWFEQRAFKKASKLANMIFLSERHKTEMRFQEWKMKNRSF